MGNKLAAGVKCVSFIKCLCCCLKLSQSSSCLSLSVPGLTEEQPYSSALISKQPASSQKMCKICTIVMENRQLNSASVWLKQCYWGTYKCRPILYSLYCLIPGVSVICCCCSGFWASHLLSLVTFLVLHPLSPTQETYRQPSPHSLSSTTSDLILSLNATSLQKNP